MDILPGFKLCRKKLHQYPADKRTCPECVKIRLLPKITCALPPGFRVCTLCQTLQPFENFNKHSKGKLRTECKTCSKTKNKKYYSQNRDKIKKQVKEKSSFNKEKIQNAKLQNKFGITLKDKENLFEKQGRCCAICKTKENVVNRGWDVDHCHDTGKVRGILCSNCNRGLGLFGDDPSVVLNAFEYLKKHKQQ